MSQMLQKFSRSPSHVAARGGDGDGVSRQPAESGKAGGTDRMRNWRRVWSYGSFAIS
jgi:hypothetical protein